VAKEFVLQMKSLRKSFATITFWHYWEEYKDASVGMYMTCKHMKHSTTGMTVSHYIEQGDRMNREKWKGYTPSQILNLITQQHLKVFRDEEKDIIIFENLQKRLQEF
jgi:hypothetical protein